MVDNRVAKNGVQCIIRLNIFMAIENTYKTIKKEDGEEQEALVLTLTNRHKKNIEELVEAYNVKEKDEAKLIAYLLAVASQEGVKGEPIGANGKFFALPDDWVEVRS